MEELRDTASTSGSRPPVYYFFFRSGIQALQSPLAVYRSFLAQVLHAQRDDFDLVDKFVFAMTESSEGQLIASRYDLLELLLLCSQWLGQAYFIIDGIDECDDAKTLVQDLLNLALKSDIKMVFFSRPNVAALFKAIPQDQQLNVGRNNSDDIRTYLTKKLEQLADEELLPTTADHEELIHCLLTGADGMFIWARLMINYLNSPALTRKSRLNIVKNICTPEGLGNMYNRIFALISQGNRIELDLAKRIIMWILYSKRPMTVQELQKAVHPRPTSSSGDDDDFPDFNRTVVLTCAGLVERQNIFISTYRSEMASFQFIHLSVKEYFLSQISHDLNSHAGFSADAHVLLASQSESLLEIAQGCLHALSFLLPTQPLSGSLDRNTTPTELHHNFPLCGYAAYYWLEHLRDTIVESSHLAIIPQEKFKDLMKALARFLTLKKVLVAWMEAAYVLCRIPEREMLQEWSLWMTINKSNLSLEDLMVAKTNSDCMELCRILKDLQDQWGDQLLRSPKTIWEEATAFTPSRLLSQTTDTKVDTLIKDAPVGPTISTKCLTKISEASGDGLYVAALSIWPSKYVSVFPLGYARLIMKLEHMSRILSTL